MAKEVFNRYEVKYMLSTDQKDAVIEALLDQMNLDPYNSGGKYYTICNIYYDTEDNTLIQRSLSRPPYKEKLRLRGYGVPKPGDIVFLEIKKKYKGIVNKRRSCIELEEAKRYMETGVLPEFQPYMNRQRMTGWHFVIKAIPASEYPSTRIFGPEGTICRWMPEITGRKC